MQNKNIGREDGPERYWAPNSGEALVPAKALTQNAGIVADDAVRAATAIAR